MPSSTACRETIMKPGDIEKLYAATFRKPVRPYFADFWESEEVRVGQERAAARAFQDRPDFGWAMARKLATAGKIPAMLKKPDCRWLRKAVVLIMAPHKLADDPDLMAIAGARDLHEDSYVRTVVQAALLTPAASAEVVAAALGLESLVIEAYEALFFSVLDRLDLAYLRQAATAPPSGPLTAYAADTGGADHRTLLEAGFNGCLQDVLQLAGCGRAGDMAAESPAENLMHRIVASGTAWLAGHPAPGALPPIVAQAIDIAKRSVSHTPDAPELDHQSTGVFYEIVSAQLKDDAQSLENEIARKHGCLTAGPATKAVQETAEVTRPKAKPALEPQTFTCSMSLVTLHHPKSDHA